MMGISKKIIEDSIKLAAFWQTKANTIANSKENSVRKQLAKLLNNTNDKNTLIKMIDYSFRAKSTSKISEQMYTVLSERGVPKFFSYTEQQLMKLFLSVGRHFHQISIPIVISEMRNFSSSSIIKGEKLTKHLKKRKKSNLRVNINHIGEAVLGEKEAQIRLNDYVEDIKNPNVESISIKISTIYSQINSLAFEHTVEELVNRLSMLYREAKQYEFERYDGTKVFKTINLDMEEYRDLNITKEIFIRTLAKPEFKDYSAGIVLQAYLPDSHNIQKEIIEFSKKRVAQGGVPIKMRIVKGANMEMEIVDSEIHNWALAPYDNKIEVDANYKRMVEYGMRNENIAAVKLGVASHNLFELAFAHTLSVQNNVEDSVTFEMLEGMGDHVRKAIAGTVKDMLMYAPVANKDQFINAIAYLIRRLDENTAPENFLRYSSDLEPDSEKWNFLKNIFLQSVDMMDKAYDKPKRTQNRLVKEVDICTTFGSNKFVNEADTDFSLAKNVDWANKIKDKWNNISEEDIIKIPVVVGGEICLNDREVRQSYDISTITKKSKKVIANYCLGNSEDVEIALKTATADPDGWKKTSTKDRHKILSKVADKIRDARADLIGCTMLSTGKVLAEADVEVSEAIDFAEFYPYSVAQFEKSKNIKMKPKGVGLVITPWNFPIAIPCGGIAASLAAGNTVIFKPASNAVLTAYKLCECFWDAGVSKNVLQFIPCNGATTGAELVKSELIDFSILTGGTDTGLRILKNNPSLFLSAETGGKNATIVTAMADRDQAAKNIVQSAFSNCGQKCSATSLLVLEKEVYNDSKFKDQLVDAVKSLSIGSVWDYENVLGPLTNVPTHDLLWGLTELEVGEKWLLKPKNINNNPYMWTPGIKDNVKENSRSHETEFFGPVLSIMKADSLKHAINIVNATGYGLTSGIESLNVGEQELWKKSIKSGNLYINRGTTGAIVLRQAFGGMGKSAFGAGIKAGSPNYVSLFSNPIESKTALPSIGVIKEETKLLWIAHKLESNIHWNTIAFKEDIISLISAIKSYTYNNEVEFSVEKDYFNLQGQDNILRYLKLKNIVVRVAEEDSVFEILARIAGAQSAEAITELSIPTGLKSDKLDFILGHNFRELLQNVNVVYESNVELAGRIEEIERIRYASPERVPNVVFETAAKTGYYIARSKVLMEGRLEMLNYYKEQSICNTYHRYGNLGDRSQ